ncbi:IPT/TIG domain-containing protein [Hymenobacter elongatus]|uniref:IPT/TIG domain-containing protein n=1 Tax=Hymenobacter elongatus TaxID=877208 RepID=A0A4Z0PQ83_9BACT|nr:IPT/TIG domain-containing protein [Hymenobacter elongatus]TGE19675.1 hypothetical protein E5J99_02640 [Hymenobacter elongatus]
MTRFYAVLCLLLAWLPAAAQTISSFAPASGNVGTLLTLRGTNLNLVTAVAVGGTAGVILDKTPTALRLLVMPSATSGPLTTTGGTPATSATAFTLTRTTLGTAQQGPKLVGTGAVGSSWQGSSVALSADGTTLAVGGHLDNNSIGATWVFTRSGTSWSQQGPKLVGTGAVGPTVYQGRSVALSADGNTLAVGGAFDNYSSGATWVFTRSGTAWSQQGNKLVGTGGIGPSLFQGYSIALSADATTLAVGGYGDSNGMGATWVFTRSGTSWSQQGNKLVGTGGIARPWQGRSVALSADGTTLAMGGQYDNNDVGATWVFTRSGTAWSQQGNKLVGTGAVATPSYGVSQGYSVALSANGTTLAAGGYYDTNFRGATWVFTRSGTAWSQQGNKLVGTGAIASPSFGVRQGASVALSADGTTLATGGPEDNTNFSGATWVFTRNGTAWSQQGNKLVGTGAAASNVNQGVSVALSADGTVLAVGGPHDNGSNGATWVFSAASSPLALRNVAAPRASADFFPNPVAGQLTVTGGASAGTLRLFDGLGRTVLTGTYRDGQPLNLPALAPGGYWLQLDQQPPRPLLKR